MGSGTYNSGSGTDVSIHRLMEQVMETVGFEGEIVFDSFKPDGAPRKLLIVDRLAALGWRVSTSFKQDLALTLAGEAITR